MDIKTTAKACRDAIQQGIYLVINPIVRLLINCGVTPNMVTTVGLLGQIAGAAVMVRAGYIASCGGNPYDVFMWAGIIILCFSVFDMLDGQVARLGNMQTAFGAMYDSVLDRYCEMVTLGGLAFYLIQRGDLWGAIITFIALVGSMMVSYVRARAESIGIECKIGFMQRPERVVVTTAGIIATGLAGISQAPGDSFNPDIIVVGAMTVIAIFANLTAIARINHCRKALNAKK